MNTTLDSPTRLPKPKRQRRIFLWLFLAVQALFILLIVVTASGHTGPSHKELADACYNHNWWPLFKSQSDCVSNYGKMLNDAGTVGKGIGTAFIIVFWCIVDIILGISYGVYKLATRH